MTFCGCPGCFAVVFGGVGARCEKCAVAGCPTSREGAGREAAIWDETACLVRRSVLKVRSDAKAASKAARPAQPVQGPLSKRAT